MEEKKIPTFEAYFQTISDIEGTLGNLIDKNGIVLFRGQEILKWELLPKLSRPEYLKYNVIEIEKQIIDEFERLSHPYLNAKSISNLWDNLALARHHNLPTRLLDWTGNPLAALWFAFNSEKKISQIERIGSFGYF